jgi:hypothetical protein
VANCVGTKKGGKHAPAAPTDTNRLRLKKKKDDHTDTQTHTHTHIMMKRENYFKRLFEIQKQITKNDLVWN